jgi:hypothetical protein
VEKDFTCILCKSSKGAEITEKKPRDRDADIVVCKECGHIQMYPLLTPEEEKAEYDEDKSLRFGKVQIAEGSDFETMRKKFSEWTKQHADMYYEKLQQHRRILELASGYGFFMENLNNRPDKKFQIEGVEISEFRLKNFTGGGVYIN